MKVGDTVNGTLFEDGVVVAIGRAHALLRYDISGALAEAIIGGELEAVDNCVAVRLGASTAVYPFSEVFEKEIA